MVLSARIVAVGRVQGVFYRATVKDIADGMHITGYARNLRNGAVEIVCECDSEEHLDDFIERINIKTEYGINVEKWILEETHHEDAREYNAFSIL